MEDLESKHSDGVRDGLSKDRRRSTQLWISRYVTSITLLLVLYINAMYFCSQNIFVRKMHYLCDAYRCSHYDSISDINAKLFIEVKVKEVLLFIFLSPITLQTRTPLMQNSSDSKNLIATYQFKTQRLPPKSFGFTGVWLGRHP